MQFPKGFDSPVRNGYDKIFFETFANIMLRKGWKGTYCFSKKCQVMHQKCAGKTYLEAKKLWKNAQEGKKFNI